MDVCTGSNFSHDRLYTHKTKYLRRGPAHRMHHFVMNFGWFAQNFEVDY